MTESMAITLTGLFFVVALLYSSVGHAGASGYLAAMAMLGVQSAVMKPTSLLLNVPVAIIGTVQFARAGYFSWRLFWPFAAASIPAAYLAARLHVPDAYYKPLIGAVLVFSAWRLWAGRAGVGGGACRPPRVWVGLAVGGALGALSGVSGTGGGIFLSPMMLLCGWANTKQTAAVSAAFILVNSASALRGLMTQTGGLPPDLERWIVPWCAAVVAGGVVGSYLGAWRLAMPTLRKLLAIVLVIAGLKLISGVWDSGVRAGSAGPGLSSLGSSRSGSSRWAHPASSGR